jgi:predicted transcriptional regulator
MPKKVPTTVKLDSMLRARLDRFVAQATPAVTLTAVIEAALAEWLDRREVKRK